MHRTYEKISGGGIDYYCMSQSSAGAVAFIMIILFQLVQIVMLINTLIALMAKTVRNGTSPGPGISAATADTHTMPTLHLLRCVCGDRACCTCICAWVRPPSLYRKRPTSLPNLSLPSLMPTV